MRDNKNNFLFGSGPIHLIWHSLVVSVIITTIMILAWALLLSLQRLPVHDVTQLASFFNFLMLSLIAIATKVLLISISSALIALWLKLGTQHLFFYRITGPDLQNFEKLKCYLTELNFTPSTSGSWILDDLLINLRIETGNWVLILRPRYWNPNIKINKKLKEMAWKIQEFSDKKLNFRIDRD
mgnify:CR=1 FL=1